MPIMHADIAGRVVVSRWLSKFNISLLVILNLNTLNELIFLLIVNPTLLSLYCAI